MSNRDEGSDSPTETATGTQLPDNPIGAALADGPMPLVTVPLEHYEIGPEHARGGLGKIVVAEDRRLGRTVAIKELIHVEESSRRRLIREARLTAKLQHPAIVPVHEAGRWPTGEPFYTMKMVSGRSLKDAMSERKTLKERLGLLPNLIAVAEAIAYAHSRKVIHRDLKPSNVLVGEFGETVVIDWGLAKDLSDESANVPDFAAGPYRVSEHEGLTSMGAVIGTPAYMPPEQARGDQVDERADVYALGAIMYHLLAGTAPYSGTSAEILSRVKLSSPPLVQSLSPQAPADLIAIVKKAMERDANARYPNAGQLAEDLVRFQAGQLVRVHEYSVRDLLARWIARHRTIALSVLVFGLIVIAVITVALRRERALRIEAEVARDRAHTETMRADRQSSTLMSQRGADELSAGYPTRAAPYFAALLTVHANDTASRFGLSEAMRAMKAVVWSKQVHMSEVSVAAFRPDGNQIITGSSDATVAILDAASGGIQQRFAFEAPVSCVDFAPDGSKVVVGTVAGDLAVIDTFNRTRRMVVGPRSYITNCQFSHDGKKLLRVTADGLVSWFAADGSGEVDVRGAKFNNINARFSPDGLSVMVIRETPLIAVYRVSDGRQEFAVDLSSEGEYAFARYCEGEGAATIAIAVGGHLELRNSATGQLIGSQQEPSEFFGIQCVGDGSTFAILGTTLDREAKLWVLGSHEPVKTYAAAPPDATWACFGSNSKILTVSERGVARTFDGPARQLLFSVDLHGIFANLPICSRDGSSILYTSRDGSVSLIRPPDGVDFSRYDLFKNYLYRITALDHGRKLALGTEKELKIFDVATRTSVLLDKRPDAFWRVRASSDSKKLLTATGTTARLYDLASGRLVREFTEHSSWVYDCALSGDGNMVATAEILGSVRMWNLETGASTVLPARGHALAFSPDGHFLVVGAEKISIWETASWRLVGELEGHPGATIDTLAFARSGDKLISGGWDDHLAKIWDFQKRTLIATLKGHSGRLMAAGFSPDGTVAVTASFDRTARVWDVTTGRLLRTIGGPTHAVAFSDDGKMLYTGIGPALYGWDVSVDSRPATEIVAEAYSQSPWLLEEGELTDRRRTGIERALARIAAAWPAAWPLFHLR